MNSYKNVVIVSGSRELPDDGKVERELDDLRPDLIVHGHNPRGADSYADRYARTKGIDFKRFPANWNEFGLAAGPIRNSEMLREFKQATLLAFPRKGPGTKDCIKQAREMGMKIIVR